MDSKIECPWCGDIQESFEYLENDGVGKSYCGVMQLYCLKCGMPFEIKQENFIGRWQVNER